MKLIAIAIFTLLSVSAFPQEALTNNDSTNLYYQALECHLSHRAEGLVVENKPWSIRVSMNDKDIHLPNKIMGFNVQYVGKNPRLPRNKCVYVTCVGVLHSNDSLMNIGVGDFTVHWSGGTIFHRKREFSYKNIGLTIIYFKYNPCTEKMEFFDIKYRPDEQTKDTRRV